MFKVQRLLKPLIAVYLNQYKAFLKVVLIMLVKRQNNLQIKFFKWFERYTSGTSRKMCSTDTKQ